MSAVEVIAVRPQAGRNTPKRSDFNLLCVSVPGMSISARS